MKKGHFLLILALASLFIIGVVSLAMAKPTGTSGVSIKGCTCHASLPDANGDVDVIVAGQTVVAPNSTNTYTVSVIPSNPAQIGGGFDASVSGGTISIIDPNTRLVSSTETVHNNPNFISWFFNWTAPASGSYRISVAAQAVNLDRATRGDSWDRATLDILVSGVPGANLPPIADPNGPYSALVGSPVNFNGSASYDIDGTIVSYNWDFGDGSTGTGPTPQHTYGAAGTYTVTLTVTDDQGATGSATTQANITTGEPIGDCVACHGPIADFSVQINTENCKTCHAETNYLRNTVHLGGSLWMDYPEWWDMARWNGYGTFQEDDPLSPYLGKGQTAAGIHSRHRPRGYGCTWCHAYNVWVTNFDTTYVDCKLCHTNVPHSTMGSDTPGAVTPTRISVLNHDELSTNTVNGELNWIYWKDYTCVDSVCHGILDQTDNYRIPECTQCHLFDPYTEHPAVGEPPPPPPPPVETITAPFDQALWTDTLKTPTDAEVKTKDITAQMKDGKLDTGFEIMVSKDKAKIIALRLNREANPISQMKLRIYVSELKVGSANLRIYPYQANGTSVNTSVKDYLASSKGWQEIDVTSVAHAMNGFGWMKFRVTSRDNTFKVSEAQATITQ